MRANSSLIGRGWLVVPIVFVVMTAVFTWFLAEPLRPAGSIGGVVSWFLAAMVLSVPYLASLVVMLIARSAVLVRIVALGYAVVAGLAGLLMDIAVVTSEGSTAPVGLAVMLAAQIFLMAPIAIIVAVVVRAVGRRRGSPQLNNVS